MRLHALLLLLFSPVLAPTAVCAQEFVRRVSTAEEAEVIAFRRLFADIELSQEQLKEAKEVFRAEAKAQFALSKDDPELWKKRIRLSFVRDSTLRHLISRPEDLRLFDQRAARSRPRAP